MGGRKSKNDARKETMIVSALIGLVVNNIYLIKIKSRAYGFNNIESIKPRLGEYTEGESSSTQWAINI